MNAISSAIQQGLTALSTDPLLIWNYGFVTVLAFVGGNMFYFAHRHLDGQEDELNAIQTSAFIGRAGMYDDEESRSGSVRADSVCDERRGRYASGDGLGLGLEDIVEESGSEGGSVRRHFVRK